MVSPSGQGLSLPLRVTRFEICSRGGLSIYRSSLTDC